MYIYVNILSAKNWYLALYNFILITFLAPNNYLTYSRFSHYNREQCQYVKVHFTKWKIKETDRFSFNMSLELIGYIKTIFDLDLEVILMTIRCLLASSDATYAQRLADGLSKTTPSTGDNLEVSLFTDDLRISEVFGSGGGKFHVAIVDESMTETAVKQIPIVMVLTEDNAKDGIKLDNLPSASYVYKYQQFTGIVRKLIMAQAQKRTFEGKGTSVACAFFSPSGGSGTSTVAAGFAMAAAKAGLRPLYASFEHFNSTEMFFTDTINSTQGFDDIFYIVAEGGGVATAIDVAKAKDATGVTFLKKFAMWTEVDQIQMNDFEIFIDSARAASETDLVVLDLDSSFTPLTDKILQCVDEIYVVTSMDDCSLVKLKALFDNRTTFFKKHLGKVNLILNKMQGEEHKENYGCKSITIIPNINQDFTAAMVASSFDSYLGRLINLSWKQSGVMS